MDFDDLQESSENSHSSNFRGALLHLARWISRKDYSEAEIRDKLIQAGISNSLHDLLIERAKSLNWISDQRVAEVFTTHKCHQWGKRRISQHLKERGIDRAFIEQATDTLSVDIEFDTAYALWQKKFKGILPDTPKDSQKQLRFFLSRGFSMSTVQHIWRAAKENLNTD